MIRGLSGHLGDTVSALIDGQLRPEEEERAWQHVLGCASCRRLVESETWIKKRMAGLSAGTVRDDAAPDRDLYARMYDVGSWAAVDHLERTERRRRAPLLAVGAGSLGLAVVGIVGLTSAPAGSGQLPTPTRASVQTNLTGTTSTVTPVNAAFRRAQR